MVSLTGFGGVGEIGGNAFLLEDKDTRIFLDFGKRFGNDPRLDARTGADTRHMVPGWNDFYDDYLQPRAFRMVPDLVRLGLIPPQTGLYRQDRGGTAGPAPVDAVLVSHAHMDHCGLLGLLRPDIPIHASVESQATLRSLQTTGNNLLNEFIEARPKGLLPNRSGEPGKGNRIMGEDGPVTVPRDYVDQDAEIGAWRMRHFGIDHSIHGARATLLEGPLSLVYTGDFRLHGRQRQETERFIERVGGADVLVAEGTRVSRTHGHGSQTDDELEVEAQIQAALDQAGDRFVGISFPPRDLDRFESVWNVARSSGRRLVIPTKLAHLLTEMRRAGRPLPDPMRDPNLAIHVPARNRGIIHTRSAVRMTNAQLGVDLVDVDDETWTDLWLSDHEAWERPYLLCDNTVTSAEVAAHPAGHLFSISYWSINELFDIFPGAGDGVYIHSMTQPFNDEMEIGDRKLRRWLDAFGLERIDTHVSGHLSEEDLHWVLDEIGARILVPVHSQAPDLTRDKYKQRTGNEALIPEPGRSLHLG